MKSQELNFATIPSTSPFLPQLFQLRDAFFPLLELRENVRSFLIQATLQVNIFVVGFVNQSVSVVVFLIFAASSVIQGRSAANLVVDVL